MAVTSNANAVWSGALADGSGEAVLGSGAEFEMGWKARAEGSGGVTPEELIAGAHASCFSMALSHALGEAGHTPTTLSTSASVEFVPGSGITKSTLRVIGTVDGISEADFKSIAEEAKAGCPVSQALAGIEIVLEEASLTQ